MREELGSNPFKENRPKDKYPSDIAGGRGIVLGAQAENPKEPEGHRHGTRDEEKVIEPVPQEGGIDPRLEQPSVQAIAAAANKKQAISQIAKLHSLTAGKGSSFQPRKPRQT
jgi:hypothetical protein